MNLSIIYIYAYINKSINDDSMKIKAFYLIFKIGLFSLVYLLPAFQAKNKALFFVPKTIECFYFFVTASWEVRAYYKWIKKRVTVGPFLAYKKKRLLVILFEVIVGEEKVYKLNKIDAKNQIKMVAS